jgi:transposase-like protein
VRLDKGFYRAQLALVQAVIVRQLDDRLKRQIVDRAYSVAEVSSRLGVSSHSLYQWVKAVTPDKTEKQATELIEAKSEKLGTLVLTVEAWAPMQLSPAKEA